ncbi:uncharacterized protein VP01_6162g1, partial [Puccinia sorghi]
QMILGHCQQLGLKKYLTNAKPPAGIDATGLYAFNTNRSKMAGILISNMGTTNYSLFFMEKNKEDPVALWELLTDHYEAKISRNHAKVYNDFITFQFKGNKLSAYLETVDKHLKLISSVGMKFEGPECDVKESLIAENIVLKLPEKYASTKDFLYAQQPLTIEIVMEVLQNKRQEISITSALVKTEETAMKASFKKTKCCEYCSNGKHNPKASHPEADCWKLQKKANLLQEDDTDDPPSRPSSSGFHCVIKAFAASAIPGMCYLNSRASHHMFTDFSLFKNYRARKTQVVLADGHNLNVTGDGLFIKTLISLGRLYEHGCEIHCTGTSSFKIVNNGIVFFKASIVGGTCMVKINTTCQGQSQINPPVKAFNIADVQILHRCAGHCHHEELKISLTCVSLSSSASIPSSRVCTHGSEWEYHSSLFQWCSILLQNH